MPSLAARVAVVIAVGVVAGAPVLASVSTASSQSTASTDDGQAGTLVEIDGGPDGDTEPYVIEYRGDARKSTADGRASVNGEDALRDGAIVGRVHGGTDAYRIRGDVTGFVVHGDATVTVDGERVDPREVAPEPARPNVLFVSGRQHDGRASYTFAATGDVARSTYRQASINRNTSTADSVSGGRVAGSVDGGADAYRFDGWFTAFGLDGDATVEVNDRRVDPASLGGPSGSPTAIDGCTVIDSSGRYELTANVTDSDERTCVRIAASDVVVDGNGHLLDGVGGNDSAAVLVDDGAARRQNVTVRNLTVTGWTTGIAAGNGGDGVTRVAVEDVVARQNGVGVDLRRVGSAALLRSTVTDSGGSGVWTSEFEDLFLRRNRLARNGGYGAMVFYGGDATLSSNEVVDNGDGGGYRSAGVLVEDVTQVRLTDNAVARSAGAGVELSYVYGGSIDGNLLEANGDAGFTGSDLSDLAITANRVRDNAGPGIAVWTGSNLVVTDNYLADNEGEALKLESVENSTVANNTVANGSG